MSRPAFPSPSRALVLLLALGLGGIALHAQPAAAPAPTLTANEPIELDAGSQMLLARGEATFVHQDFTLVADEVRFFRRENRAEAVGNVRIVRGPYRVVARRAEYRVATRTFLVEDFRGGTPPAYVAGAHAEGTPDDFVVKDATITYGEPDRWSPRITATEARWRAGEGIDATGAVLRAGPLPLAALPRVSAPVDTPGFSADGAVGYRGNLGAYAEADVLLPVAPTLSVGPRVGLYSERGWLLGPRVELRPGAAGSTEATLDGGYLNDRGDKGLDNRGLPVPEDRGFVDFTLRHRLAPDTTFTATTTYWSDSAVARDFLRDRFDDDQEPDSWAEFDHAHGPWSVSAFLRGRVNDFQLSPERLPEVRVELMPTAVLDTGVFAEVQASVARLEEDAVSPFSFTDRTSDRADLLAVLRRPTRIAPHVTATPVAGVRGTHYLDAAGGSLARVGGQLGLDLEAVFHRDWDVRLPAWGLSGLRHVVRPQLRHRWQPVDESGIAAIPVLDERRFVTGLPAFDLADQRFVDGIRDDHRVRAGLEHAFLTRDAAGGWREFASAGVHQDIALGSGAADAWDSTYLRFAARPARWLLVDYYQSVATEAIAGRESRLRLVVRDRDYWEAGLTTDYLRGTLEQYALETRWNVTRGWGLRGRWQYDAVVDAFTEQRYGLVQRLGHSWEILWEIVLRDGSTREDETSFRVSAVLLRF